MSAAAPELVADVAEVVGLDEGEAGIVDVVRVVARLEPVAVRKISRATELPVPIVSAICNELRKRGVVARERPVQLTPGGRELFADVSGRAPVAAGCASCDGHEIVVPSTLATVARRLAAAASAAPPRRVELDQTHCTVDTKLRRVLMMHEEGALAGKRVVLLGDDDLTALAIALAAEELGLATAIRGLVIVDIDPAVVSFLRRALRRAPFPVDVLVHDLRRPLPERLRGMADTAFTDPPYTAEGATLFLSRAAEATAGRSRADVFLAFGGRRPDTVLALQRALVDMGFVVRRLVRNFNEYLGAGALAGTSHLYQLATTAAARPLVAGDYDGPLYTGDVRHPVRGYRCKRCRTIERVGPGQRSPHVGALKRDGCPRCGANTFEALTRPGPRG